MSAKRRPEALPPRRRAAPRGSGRPTMAADRPHRGLPAGAPTAFTVLVPARYASTRLPGKPLADIAGKPMVVRVAERAMASGAARVVVATDDERVQAAVAAHGIERVPRRAPITSPVPTGWPRRRRSSGWPTTRSWSTCRATSRCSSRR